MRPLMAPTVLHALVDTSGMEVQVAQQNLGHAVLGITIIYVTTEQKKRVKVVGKYWSSTPK